MKKSKWCIPFGLAVGSGFASATYASKTMGVQNNPYTPYAIFFAILAVAFLVVAVALAENGKR